MNVMTEPEAPRPGATAEFTARLIDHFFRRAFLYLLPVALFAALGVYTASNTRTEYVSEGKLTASQNPLLEPTEIRTTELGRNEGPAAGSARLITEQLRTDAFIDDVAARSGLSEALETGIIERETIRRQISAADQGVNVFAIEARWGDPQTAFLLVQSTIDAYIDLIDEILVGDSADAVAFLETQLTSAEGRFATAENDLDDYVSSLPPLTQGERPAEVTTQLSLLTAAIVTAQESVAALQQQIDLAELSVDQAQSAAGRQLRTVDSPVPALEPESSLVQRLITVVAFAAMGALLALTVLVLSAVFDRTVRTKRQLSEVAGCDVIVSVPRLRKSRRSKRAPREASSEREAA